MPRIRDLLIALLALGAAGVRGAVEPASNAEAVAWMPIATIQTCLGLNNVERLTDGIAFFNDTHSLRLFAGRRTASLDGVGIWLQVPPRDAATNDLRDVSRADFVTLLQPILLATAAPPAHPRIVLDAGHGGEDTGARSLAPPVRDKDISLDIVCHVAAILTNAGQQVLLTRATDTYETPGDRARYAAARHAQLFISIHANSSPSNSLAAGAETYILPSPGFPGTGEFVHGPTNACPGNRFDPDNALLGFSLHRRYAPLTAADRGLKRGRYFVLKEAPCPAVLVECGFLTNTNDAARLADAAYRQKLAEAIAAGILDYLSLASHPPAATNGLCATSAIATSSACTNTHAAAENHKTAEQKSVDY